MHSGKYKSPEAAVPALIAEGVKDGIVPAADTKRLTELFQVWFKGVTWAKCQLSSTNRPSLGSWNGWPWDEQNVSERSLSRGLVGTNVQIHYQIWPYEEAFHPDLFPYVLQLWTSSAGRTDDIDTKIRATYEAYKIRLVR